MKALLLVSILVMLFGLVSQRLHRTVLTPPMVFVLVGLSVGSGVLGSFGSYDGFELTRVLAELTLVLVLFTDASRIQFRELKTDFHLPFRLLVLGMPATILLGGFLALLVCPRLDFWPAFVLAAVLAPTDAALGQAVVSSERVPLRIRQALNVESGLNDGLALPVVLLLAALANMTDERVSAWLVFAVTQLTLGPLVGAVVGFSGGQIVASCARRRWMELSFQQLSALALAFLSFLLAEMLGGNGFIAAFVAGLTIGNTAGEVGSVLQEFAETEGQLLSLLTFLCFGAHFAWPLLGDLQGGTIVYAVLSLTVIRIVPVCMCLVGAGLRPVSYLFLGWFGPRGLASILFAFLVIEEGVPNRDDLLSIVVATVLLSVFAHGMTAWPASNVYARFCKARRDDAPEEWASAHALAPRINM